MNKIVTRRANILSALVAVVSLGVVSFVGFWSFPNLFPNVPADPPTGTDLAGALARVGAFPDALAAAGVSATQAGQAVSAVRTVLSTEIEQLRAADTSYADANARVTRLSRLVRAGTASQQDRDDLASATSDLSQAQSQRQAVLDDVWQAVVGALTQSQIATVQQIKTNRRTWHLPLPYLVLDRTEAQFIDLRNALANQRISTKRGTQPDQGMAQIVQAADSDPACVAARQALTANGDAVETAWKSAVDSN